jgi:hypothetical protein
MKSILCTLIKTHYFKLGRDSIICIFDSHINKFIPAVINSTNLMVKRMKSYFGKLSAAFGYKGYPTMLCAQEAWARCIAYNRGNEGVFKKIKSVSFIPKFLSHLRPRSCGPLTCHPRYIYASRIFPLPAHINMNWKIRTTLGAHLNK